MPPRPEDLAAHGLVPEVTVQLRDLEPVLGLVSAVSRFCATLTQAALDAMSEDSQIALGDVQAVLWRLQNTVPEQPPPAAKER
ncbi:hypothetical protein [Actinomadura opuntiae]|uniref:hypothetical protein n=1 Tax=Actinomadura sp. OS1-43 TaxID=604315 RepID=UPI00255A7188|nr:hypothetical protein [Actinomadura sp. OS1-43]MDL4812816.1 hypothetical protein [Actinomadura sp. OS1-43]